MPVVDSEPIWVEVRPRIWVVVMAAMPVVDSPPSWVAFSEAISVAVRPPT